MAPLEKAKYALTFSSGLGALTTLSYLLKTGDHIVTVDDVYGGTNRFFRNCASRMGIETSFVDMTNLEETEKAFQSNTTFCWIGIITRIILKNILFFLIICHFKIETPTNPTLKLVKKLLLLF